MCNSCNKKIKNFLRVLDLLARECFVERLLEHCNDFLDVLALWLDCGHTHVAKGQLVTATTHTI